MDRNKTLQEIMLFDLFNEKWMLQNGKYFIFNLSQIDQFKGYVGEISLVITRHYLTGATSPACQ